MALNKTIDVLGDLYKLYKNSDTPTRHMYHKALFETLVVDDRKIVDIKWKVPFSSLYQPNPQSVLQLSGEPANTLNRLQEFSEKFLSMESLPDLVWWLQPELASKTSDIRI